MNKRIRLIWVGLTASLLTVTHAADRTWLPTAGGSYEWQNAANWSGGILPGAGDQAQMRTVGQTGDQTIHVANPVSLFSFFPGASDGSLFSQTFTGAALSPSSSFRVMGGHAIIENTVSLNGGTHSLGLVKAGTLTLRDAGLLYSTNCAALNVGHRNTATTYFGGAGALFVENGGTVRMRGTTNSWTGGIFVGVNENTVDAGNPGKVWQSGGLVDLESLWIVGDRADGYYRLDGGTVRLPAVYADGHRVGNNKATYSQLHVSGGLLDLPYKFAVSGNLSLGFGSVAGTQPAYSDFYLSGGAVSAPDRAIVLANWTTLVSGTVAHQATMTVDGTALVTGRNIGLGNSLSPAVRASLNLNGGLLSLNYYLSRFGGAGNQAFLNFNGGTLQWRSWGYSFSPIANFSNITVFSKGGTLDTTGVTIMTDTPFRTAKGFGVGGVTLSNPGSGYGAAPRVALTGGSGSNATAVAVMTKTGTVERVVVTCAGEGYAETDVLTVAFIVPATGVGYGGGAAASVVMAENTPGTFTKVGGGTWQVMQPNTFEGTVNLSAGYLNLTDAGGFPDVSTFTLAGGIFQSFAGQDNRVNPSATLELAGASAPVYRSQTPAAGSTSTQQFARLSAKPGVATFDAAAGDGTAEILFGTYDRQGSAVLYTPESANKIWLDDAVLSDGSPISPSTVSPVVAGFVTADGNNLVERDATTGYLQTASTSGTPAADSNFLVPTGVSTGSASQVNSIVFDDVDTNAEFYFDTAGTVAVRSGMIVSGSQKARVKRVGTLAGGALTTEMPGGMVIYDNENSDRRAFVGYGGRYMISTSVADPSVGTPMAVTIAGRRISPLTGALVRFTQANTFSGGLYLANGGVWFDGDDMLGAAGNPIVAAGLCALRPSGSILETGTQRPIEILENSELQLLGYTVDFQLSSRIQGPLSGSGALLTGEYGGAGRRTVTELTGDNNAFTGAYYVFGAVRAAEGVGLSTNANIRFSDNTSGLGTLDLSGTFTRPLGDGAGAVCWMKYPSFGGLYGGFSAYGGPLTVNLHGDARTLEWGSASLPSTAVVVLQNRMATHALTFMNGMDLKGLATPHIRVSTDLEKTVYFKGVISDSVGGGTLTKGGQGVLVLEQSPTMNGKLAIISGKVRLAEGVSLNTLSEVSITGDGKALEIMGTQGVQTVSCNITGTGEVILSDGGTTVLSGTNTYTGVTVVTNGSTLLVNGQHTGGGDYLVTGTLGGTGTITPAEGNKLMFGPGSRLSPGGPGVIGTLTLGAAAAETTVELNGATLEVDLGAVNSDKVVIEGDLSVAGDTAVEILAPDEELLKSLRGSAVTICEWTGDKVGSFTAKSNVGDWRVVEDAVAKTISLVYVSPGTMVRIF